MTPRTSLVPFQNPEDNWYKANTEITFNCFSDGLDKIFYKWDGVSNWKQFNYASFTESLTVVSDGTETHAYLFNTPIILDNLRIYKDASLMTYVTDYTVDVSIGKISFLPAFSLSSGDVVTAKYNYTISNTETLNASQDQTFFQLEHPFITEISVLVNGTEETNLTFDYNLGMVYFSTPLNVNDIVEISYSYVFLADPNSVVSESVITASGGPKTIVLSHTTVADSESVFLNSIRKNKPLEYTISGSTITFSNEMKTNDVVDVDYTASITSEIVTTALAGQTTCFLDYNDVVDYTVSVDAVLINKTPEYTLDGFYIDLSSEVFPTGLTTGDYVSVSYNFWQKNESTVTSATTGQTIFNLFYGNVQPGSLVIKKSTSTYSEKILVETTDFTVNYNSGSVTLVLAQALALGDRITSEYISSVSNEVIVLSALGGETKLRLHHDYPIAITQVNYDNVRNLKNYADYILDVVTGEIDFATPLNVGDVVTATYTFSTTESHTITTSGELDLSLANAIVDSLVLKKNTFVFTDYILDAISGKITLVNPLEDNDVVTADYTYYTSGYEIISNKAFTTYGNILGSNHVEVLKGGNSTNFTYDFTTGKITFTDIRLTTDLFSTTYLYAPTTSQNESFFGPGNTTFSLSFTPLKQATIIKGITTLVEFVDYNLNYDTGSLVLVDPLVALETINVSYISGGNLVIPSTGVHGIEFYAVDTNNVKEDTKVFEFSLDPLPPITIADLPTGAQTEQTIISFYASDSISGVENTYYTIDGTEPTTSSLSGSFVTLTETTTLKYFSIDFAGNIENTQTSVVEVIIDTVAPTAHIQDSFPINGLNGYYTTPPQVSIIVTDELYVDKIYSKLVSQDNITTAKYTSTDVISTTIDLSSNYNISLEVDQSGTEILIDMRGFTPSETTITEIIDNINTAMQTVYNVLGENSKTNGFTLTTNNPNIASVSKIRNETTSTNYMYVSKTYNTVTFTLLNPGDKAPLTTDIMSVDYEYTSQNIAFETSIDGTSGSGYITLLSPTGATGSPTSEIKFLQPSNADGTQLVFGLGTSFPYTFTESNIFVEYTTPITLPSNGRYTLQAYATDLSGNIGETVRRNYQIDSILPTSSLVIVDGVLGDNGYYIENPTIQFSGTDNLSGINNLYYKWNSATPPFQTYRDTRPVDDSTTIPSDGSHILYYYGIDRAGNTEVVKTQTFILDTVSPITVDNTVSATIDIPYLNIIKTGPSTTVTINNNIMTFSGIDPIGPFDLNNFTLKDISDAISSYYVSKGYSCTLNASTPHYLSEAELSSATLLFDANAISVPSSGGVRIYSGFSIKLEATDATSGVENIYYSYTTDGTLPTQAITAGYTTITNEQLDVRTSGSWTFNSIATGGETEAKLKYQPIYSLVLRKNPGNNLLVEGVDYTFDERSGKISLTASLTIGQTLVASYIYGVCLSFYEDGVYKVRYHAKDKAGNIENKVDEVVIASAFGNETSVFLSNQNIVSVTLVVKKNNNILVLGTDYTVDYTTAEITFTSQLAVGDSITAVYNYDSFSQPIIVQRNLPAISYTPPATTNWFITNPNITILATPIGATITSLYYRWDSNPFTLVLTPSVLTTIPSDGTHVLEAYAIDSLNRVSQIHTETYKKDEVKPVSTDNSILYFDGLPGHNGIETVIKFTTDHETEAYLIHPYASNVIVFQNAIPLVLSVDYTINLTSGKITFIIPPPEGVSITASYQSLIATNTTFNFTINVADSTSGAYRTYYEVYENGFPVIPTTSSPYFSGSSGVIPLTTTNQWVVKYFSVDAAGNTESIKTSEIIRVNRLMPNTTLVKTPTLPNGNNNYYVSSPGVPTLSFIVDSHASDVKYTYYRLSSTLAWVLYGGIAFLIPDGNYDLQFYSVDLTGNVETINTVTFKQDGVVPVTTDVIPNGFVSLQQITLTATDSVSGAYKTFHKILTSTLLPVNLKTISNESLGTVVSVSIAKTAYPFLVTGSESLFLNSLPLTFGVNYTVDYDYGIITFITPVTGVLTIDYQCYIDFEGNSEGSVFNVTSEGDYIVQYFSIDNAGNYEVVKTAANLLKMDLTPPRVYDVYPVDFNITDTTTAIGFKVQDIGVNPSGIDPFSIRVFVDNIEYSLLKTSNLSGLTAPYFIIKATGTNIQNVFNETSTSVFEVLKSPAVGGETEFSFANLATCFNTQKVYKNSVLLRETIDYIFDNSLSKLTLIKPLDANDVLQVEYRYLTVFHNDYEVAICSSVLITDNIPNGSLSYVMTDGVPESVRIVDGVSLIDGIDYQVVNQNITFTAPTVNAVITYNQVTGPLKKEIPNFDVISTIVIDPRDASGNILLPITYTFTTPDTQPFIVDLRPLPNSKDVSLTTNVMFNVFDDSGVDIQSLKININGVVYGLKTQKTILFQYLGVATSAILNIENQNFITRINGEVDISLSFFDIKYDTMQKVVNYLNGLPTYTATLLDSKFSQESSLSLVVESNLDVTIPVELKSKPLDTSFSYSSKTNGYLITVAPPPFDNQQTVSVVISCSDINGNAMTPVSYSFKTQLGATESVRQRLLLMGERDHIMTEINSNLASNYNKNTSATEIWSYQSIFARELSRLKLRLIQTINNYYFESLDNKLLWQNFGSLIDFLSSVSISTTQYRTDLLSLSSGYHNGSLKESIQNAISLFTSGNIYVRERYVGSDDLSEQFVFDVLVEVDSQSDILSILGYLNTDLYKIIRKIKPAHTFFLLGFLFREMVDIGAGCTPVLLTDNLGNVVYDNYGNPKSQYDGSSYRFYKNGVELIEIKDFIINNDTIVLSTALVSGDLLTGDYKISTSVVDEVITGAVGTKLCYLNFFPVVPLTFTVWKNNILLYERIDYTIETSSGVVTLKDNLLYNDEIVISYDWFQQEVSNLIWTGVGGETIINIPTIVQIQFEKKVKNTSTAICDRSFINYNTLTPYIDFKLNGKPKWFTLNDGATNLNDGKVITTIPIGTTSYILPDYAPTNIHIYYNNTPLVYGVDYTISGNVISFTTPTTVVLTISYTAQLVDTHWGIDESVVFEFLYTEDSFFTPTDSVKITIDIELGELIPVPVESLFLEFNFLEDDNSFWLPDTQNEFATSRLSDSFLNSNITVLWKGMKIREELRGITLI